MNALLSDTRLLFRILGLIAIIAALATGLGLPALISEDGLGFLADASRLQSVLMSILGLGLGLGLFLLLMSFFVTNGKA